MCKLFFIIAFSLFSVSTIAQDIFTVSGAKSTALGMTGVCQTDVWSVQNNQAGLAFLEKPSLGVFYDNRFGLKETSLKNAAFALPTKSGTFGLAVNYFGYKLFNQSRIGLAYGKRLSEKISIGIQLNYLQTVTGENYGKSGALAAEIGFYSKISKNTSFATHIFNPTRAKVSKYYNEQYPTLIKLGFLNKFSDKTNITIELQKDLNFKPSVNGGIEYHLAKPIYIRLGISSNPFYNTFGIGLEFNRFVIDFSARYHSMLGLSSQFSLNYKL
ncbi:MAG: hypothetical protein WCK02_10800 [Bacteroidota bacterium]